MKSKVTFTTIFILTVLLTLVWQTNTVKSEIVTDGLVSYWSFDEDTIEGKTVKDSWGENHGTIQGSGLKTVKGKVHEAMEFPGTGDHLVIVPKSIDKYANYNARLRLSGHGANSGQRIINSLQKLDRSTHRQILFQSVALWSDIKGSRKVNVC